jgi:murein DD-endopeptidase MepM/ murein hydrolase activator NlpD
MHRDANKKSIAISQIMAQFPRQHLILAGIAIALIFVALLMTPGKQVQAKRTSQPLVIQLPPLNTPEPEAEKIQEPAKETWTEIKVRGGDSLSKIFKRAELSGTTLHELMTSTPRAKQLTQIYPGQKFSFHIDEHGELQALKHIQSQLKTTLYERTGESYSVKFMAREPEAHPRYSSATISSSLYLAADNAGLPQNLIMELANVFGGVIDFIYDVRAGDSFNILYEEHFIDGERYGNGPILAAQFTNQGETYTAYRYIYENGEVGYYNEDGISMRKAFLRSPVDFTRISSNFNPKRLHPVFKTSRPHRGIDYAAATGTPVYASGDGRVVTAGYTKANGNYLVIKHGEKYTTKYLHLRKRGVRRGQKIKQQQIIGWVGSTGYATGPHLHYEFLVNGVHRNPRTILNKLPKAKSINTDNKTRFLAQISGFQLQLATYNNHNKVAIAEQATDKNTL